MRLIFIALIGLLFGAGILISGMADPNKVLNFFDVLGTWDPSLAFVMGGGLAVNLVGYQLIFRLRQKPMMAPDFPKGLPQQIDPSPPMMIMNRTRNDFWMPKTSPTSTAPR